MSSWSPSRAARGLARNRKAFAPIPPPVPLPAGRAAGSSVTLAMGDPLDFETIAAVRTFTGLRVEPVLAAEQEILDAVDKLLRREPTEPQRRRLRRRRRPGCRKISSTCATWRARRRSSAWSTP